MRKLKVAILGYGRSGSSLHANSIANVPNFEMTAVCDIDKERLNQAKERFNCRTYENYFEMLEKEELDLISIVTRSHQHCEMACDCLKAGVNVLVTKPWCVSAEEAEKMIDASKQSGKLLLPWLPARWGCDFIRLKQLIAEGAIGKVFFIRRGVYSFGLRNDWQTENKYGGGYVLNWGPHILDTSMLLADSEITSVYGILKQVINPGNAEDNFFAILNTQNGITIRGEYSVAVQNLPSWFIQGDKGTITVDDKKITISKAELVMPDDPTKTLGLQPKPEIIEEELDGDIYGDGTEIYTDIAKALRDEQKYPVTPESALYLSKVFDAVKKSHREGQVINL